MNIFVERLREAGVSIDRCFFLYRRNAAWAIQISALPIGAQLLAVLLAWAALDTDLLGLGIFLVAFLGNAFLGGFALLLPVLGIGWLMALVQSASLSWSESMLWFALAVALSAALGVPALLADGALTHWYLQSALDRPAQVKASWRAAWRARRPLWVISVVRLLPNLIGEGAFVLAMMLLLPELWSLLRRGWVEWVPMRTGLGMFAITLALSVVVGVLASAAPAVMLEQVSVRRALRLSVALARSTLLGLMLRVLLVWSVRLAVVALPLYGLFLLLPWPSLIDVNRPLDVLMWALPLTGAALSGVLAFPLYSAFAVVNYLHLRAHGAPTIVPATETAPPHLESRIQDSLPSI
ncbi:MAG: hypothetical protein RMN25_06500 [Anaerolineae bacterium]|nr:hypothetical protein [Thermoflexales bacterium]MDW8407419.1 hypothetical protein [Anaerolineae bacterium]